VQTSGSRESWVRGGFASVAFYKDQLGSVHLKGLAQGSDFAGVNWAGAAVFRLPAAYRPDFRRAFASVGRDGYHDLEVDQGRVDGYPDGLVTFINDCVASGDPCSAAGGHVTLDGISFRPDE